MVEKGRKEGRELEDGELLMLRVAALQALRLDTSRRHPDYRMYINVIYSDVEFESQRNFVKRTRGTVSDHDSATRVGRAACCSSPSPRHHPAAEQELGQHRR